MEKISGSITLKRLKRGVNVILYISTSGGAMYQGWDKATGKVSPDFTVAANQPILTPTAKAGEGQTVSINSGTWTYNDTPLTPSGTETDAEGFTPCTDTRFKICTDSTSDLYLSLRIVGNIASEGNLSNDVFKFSGEGECGGVAWKADASQELHLQEIGTSAAVLLLTADKKSIESDNDFATVKATLMVSGTEMTSGYTYVFKDESGTTLTNKTDRTCEVGRGNITAIGGVWCFAYLGNDTKATAVASAFIELIDLADKYELEVHVDKDWDGTNKQTVTAVLYQYSAATGKGDVVPLTGYTVSHSFVGAVSQQEVGSATGITATVDSTIWSKVGENEDVIDFVSVSK